MGTRSSSPCRGLSHSSHFSPHFDSELKEIKATLRSLVSQVYNYVESGVCSQMFLHCLISLIVLLALVGESVMQGLVVLLRAWGMLVGCWLVLE